MLHCHLKPARYVTYFRVRITATFSTHTLFYIVQHNFLYVFPPHSQCGEDCAKFGEDIGQSLVIYKFVLDFQ